MESKFGVGVGRFEWLEDKNLWSVSGLDGQSLGQFNGAVASDKNVVSPRFRDVTGRPPPLGISTLSNLSLNRTVAEDCFVVLSLYYRVEIHKIMHTEFLFHFAPLVQFVIV